MDLKFFLVPPPFWYPVLPCFQKIRTLPHPENFDFWALETAKDALSAARLLSETMGARAFVTDGPALAAAVFGDEIAVAQPESIVGSVTGAGDVFTAAALLALLRSAPLGEALADGVEASAARIRTAS
ncbi:MAG: PfkB family carbohydrate kinase [Pseudomonadota bacterium]